MGFGASFVPGIRPMAPSYYTCRAGERAGEARRFSRLAHSVSSTTPCILKTAPGWGLFPAYLSSAAWRAAGVCGRRLCSPHGSTHGTGAPPLGRLSAGTRLATPLARGRRHTRRVPAAGRSWALSHTTRSARLPHQLSDLHPRTPHTAAVKQKRLDCRLLGHMRITPTLPLVGSPETSGSSTAAVAP